MAPHTVVCTLGPQHPVVVYRCPSSDIYGLWLGMVDPARHHMSEREGGGASRQHQMSWTSNDQMVAHMSEWVRHD
eukprot:CAMPEP_0197720312 /NCGR_PEP_ID=MMETSP1434-20131217/3718_1 /TAXON_ID=265543 /ORGANISM="Minutocellus polymorphus, Strain CCMP3303" /LENGTH=74 /DNA_ID=CAMNT_0043305157 /DNA_START=127 /DNA_END=351 /DNA_ORIENTATION=-